MKTLKYNNDCLYFFDEPVSDEQILKWVQDNLENVLKHEPMYVNDYWADCKAYLEYGAIFITGDETSVGLDIERVEVVTI